MSKMKSLDSVLDTARVPLDEMPLETIRDYRLYNEEVRRMNKQAAREDRKLKIAPYQIKQCPEELHPTQRVAMHENAQPNNPVKAYLSNEHIHYDKVLTPGKEYDIPQVVVTHMAECHTPKWGYVNLPDGTRETRLVSKTPRFSIRTIYE